jgi:ATP-binding protein involved in chromosome partitioning
MKDKEEKIYSLLENFHFSDQSSLKTRMSKLILKEGKLGFSFNVQGLDLEEAKIVKEKIVNNLKNSFPQDQIDIILTKHNFLEQNPKLIIEKVDKIIAVISGKGGVGKSSMAALLAYHARNKGLKVGILDADIYGPSIPHLFNIQEMPIIDNKRMIPVEKDEIKLNSIGFITAPNIAHSWRGPMVSKALYQLLSLTNWGISGKLDYLIIDTPPGTGDVHLSLIQNYHIDQAVIVTSPPLIAQIDTEKSINLCQKLKLPIAGIIENMSNSDKNGAGKNLAKQHNLSLLAQIPFKQNMMNLCDQGKGLSSYSFLLKNMDLF